MVRGVSGGVDGPQPAVTGRKQIAVGDRKTLDRLQPIAFRPRQLPEPGVGPLRRDRAAAIGMVGVRVGHEHLP